MCIIENDENYLLKTYRLRGTELSFLLLVRSVDPADRRCDGRTDGRTDGHDKGARGLLVSNTLKLSCSGYLKFNA